MRNIVLFKILVSLKVQYLIGFCYLLGSLWVSNGHAL